MSTQFKKLAAQKGHEAPARVAIPQIDPSDVSQPATKVSEGEREGTKVRKNENVTALPAAGLPKGTSRAVVEDFEVEGGKTIKRVRDNFSSKLFIDSKKALKQIAIELDLNDYDVLQMAVDEYVKAKGHKIGH